MNKWEFDINEMMNAFGQTTRIKPDCPPVSSEEINLRKKLVEEEAKELVQALNDGDLVNLAKEICDVLVVTIGVARTFGLDIEPLWNAVHKSNMAKTTGPVDPNTGKRLKPEGWQKPDLKSLLVEMGWDLSEE